MFKRLSECVPEVGQRVLIIAEVQGVIIPIRRFIQIVVYNNIFNYNGQILHAFLQDDGGTLYIDTKVQHTKLFWISTEQLIDTVYRYE